MSSQEDTSIPSWYCPFRIPAILSEGFHPVVYLVGLDVSSHRGVLESFNLQNITKRFKPVYKLVPIGHKFPTKKPKNDPECNVPQGIIKSGWASKHLNEIPSAVVVFFSLNWTSADWNEKKLECAQRIKSLKAEVNPHGTQVLVMLIKAPGVGEDLNSERASALCAAADILPKHLFVLPLGHLERITTCTQRLEREAEVYYKTRIKRIAAMKEKAAHPPLIVRYNFKIAFFQEILTSVEERAEFEAALSHYQAAYDALLNIKVTEANVQELKTVASVLVYRMCRMCLLSNNLKDGKAQFDKHIRSFYKVEGNPNLAFEHLAWLEQQYHMYGELLQNSYRIGSNFPNPVDYFLMASRYAEKRKQFYIEKVEPVAPKEWIPEMAAFKGEVNLPFIGQRPWRTDSMSLANVFEVVEDPRAIALLTYLESKTNHSGAIIKHLGVASEFCKKMGRKRMRCLLMSSMGVEFYSVKDYKNCILLMTHVLRELSYNNWNKIIVSVAECGLKAACCEGDVPKYLNFLVVLLKTDLTDEDRSTTNLASKFQAVLDGRMPLVEDQCEINVEAWQKGLSSPFEGCVECHSHCILDFPVYFTADTAVYTQTVNIRFELTNRADFPITVRKYGVLRFNIPEYNKIESPCDITLQPGEKRELDLPFKPLQRDVGKIIQVQVAFVDIGRENRSVILHNSVLLSNVTSAWIEDWKKDKCKQRQTVVKVEAPRPLLEVKMDRKGTALVNEWYKFKVTWTNTESTDYTKIVHSYILSASDSKRITIASDPAKGDKRMPGAYTYTARTDTLAPGSSVDHVLYIKTTNPADTEVKLAIEGQYFDSHGQRLMLKYEETMDVLGPFEVTQSTMNLQGEKIDHISIGDEFCLNFAVQNISKVNLNLISASLNMKSAHFTLKPGTEKQIENTELIDGERIELLFFLTATGIDSASIGHLEIQWERKEDASSTAKTEVPVIPLSNQVTSLYLHAAFSNNGRGKLKTPLLACYTIMNRSSYVQDLAITMDPNESFMSGGPKKITMTLKAQEEADFSYIFFPLVTGCVPVPHLNIETRKAEGGGGGGGEGKTQTIVDSQDVPKTIFVSP